MVVIDASALIEFLLDAARYPRIDEIISSRELHAPHLIDVEIIHGLRSAVLGKRLSVERAMSALEDFSALPIRRHGVDRLLMRSGQSARTSPPTTPRTSRSPNPSICP